MNEEKIVTGIATIQETVLDSFNDREKLLVLSNLLLDISKKYLPEKLAEDSVNLLSDGKSVAYQVMTHTNNPGLNLALKAHHIINIANQIGD